jgi:hypothetical protein
MRLLALGLGLGAFLVPLWLYTEEPPREDRAWSIAGWSLLVGALSAVFVILGSPIPVDPAVEGAHGWSRALAVYCFGAPGYVLSWVGAALGAFGAAAPRAAGVKCPPLAPFRGYASLALIALWAFRAVGVPGLGVLVLDLVIASFALGSVSSIPAPTEGLRGSLCRLLDRLALEASSWTPLVAVLGVAIGESLAFSGGWPDFPRMAVYPLLRLWL